MKGFSKSRWKKIKINEKHKTAYMLGNTYKYNEKQPNESLSLFLQDHQQILWFSYRTNFPLIRDSVDEKQSSSNDYGWGCMIRCNQMLLAEALKRQFQNDFEITLEKASNYLKKSIFKNIIKLFLDCTTSDSEKINPNDMYSPFSIQSICNRALLKQYQKNVKNWYSSIQVSYIFQEMLEENILLGAKTPLRIVNFTDQIIFIKELQNAAFSYEKESKNSIDGLQRSSELIEEIEQIKDFIPEKEKGSLESDSEPNQQMKCNLLVMLHMKFGLSKFNLAHKKYFLDLIQIPYFIGALSGTDAKGTYIVGYQENYVIIFDPHFVQESTPGMEGLEKEYSTYFSKEPRCLAIEELSSDISIGFFLPISEKDSLDRFIDQIFQLNQNYKEQLISVLADRVEVNDSTEEVSEWPSSLIEQQKKKNIGKQKIINKQQQEEEEEEEEQKCEIDDIQVLREKEEKEMLRIEEKKSQCENFLSSCEIKKKIIESTFYISNGSCLSDSHYDVKVSEVSDFEVIS